MKYDVTVIAEACGIMLRDVENHNIAGLFADKVILTLEKYEAGGYCKR